MLNISRSPLLKGFHILSKDMAIAEMVKEKVTLDRPNFLGTTILEISKVIVYNFYYNVIKQKFGPRARVLYSDTDILIMELIHLLLAD